MQFVRKQVASQQQLAPCERGHGVLSSAYGPYGRRGVDRGWLRLPYEPDPGKDDPEPARRAFRASREVRHTVIRIIATHLKDGAAVSWQGLNFDFTGVVFDGGDFSDVEFSGGTVDFSHAEFIGGTIDFSRVLFSDGTVSFSYAEFSGGTVYFPRARFCGAEVYFGTANFSGAEICLVGVEFSAGVVSFGEAWFSGGRVDFRLLKGSGRSRAEGREPGVGWGRSRRLPHLTCSVANCHVADWGASSPWCSWPPGRSQAGPSPDHLRDSRAVLGGCYWRSKQRQLP